MNVQKTIQRWGKPLAHGLFRVRETIYACASRRKKGHRVVTARSSFLAQLLLPHSTVGYDLLVYVGCQRFVHYRQREEMRAELKERYGIVLSTRSEEHTSELQSRLHLVCRLLLEKKKKDVEDADALLSGM